jgi:hypothetical protein
MSEIFGLEKIYRKQLNNDWPTTNEVWGLNGVAESLYENPVTGQTLSTRAYYGNTKVCQFDTVNDTDMGARVANNSNQVPGYGWDVKTWLSNTNYGYMLPTSQGFIAEGTQESRFYRLDYATDTNGVTTRGATSNEYKIGSGDFTVYRYAAQSGNGMGNNNYGYFAYDAISADNTLGRLDYGNDTSNTVNKLPGTAYVAGQMHSNTNYGYILGGNIPAPRPAPSPSYTDGDWRTLTSAQYRYSFSNDTSPMVTRSNWPAGIKDHGAFGTANYGYVYGGIQNYPSGTPYYIPQSQPSFANTDTNVWRMDYSNDTNGWSKRSQIEYLLPQSMSGTSTSANDRLGGTSTPEYGFLMYGIHSYRQDNANDTLSPRRGVMHTHHYSSQYEGTTSFLYPIDSFNDIAGIPSDANSPRPKGYRYIGAINQRQNGMSHPANPYFAANHITPRQRKIKADNVYFSEGSSPQYASTGGHFRLSTSNATVTEFERTFGFYAGKGRCAQTAWSSEWRAYFAGGIADRYLLDHPSTRSALGATINISDTLQDAIVVMDYATDTVIDNDGWTLGGIGGWGHFLGGKATVNRDRAYYCGSAAYSVSFDTYSGAPRFHMYDMSASYTYYITLSPYEFPGYPPGAATTQSFLFEQGTMGNQTYGYWGGGQLRTPGNVSTGNSFLIVRSNVDRFEYSTFTSYASLQSKSNLPAALYGMSHFYNKDYGWFVAGSLTWNLLFGAPYYFQDPVSNIQKYDYSSDTWTTSPSSLPFAGAKGSASFDSEYAYLHSGDTGYPHPANYFNTTSSIYRLDISNDTSSAYSALTNNYGQTLGLTAGNGSVYTNGVCSSEWSVINNV